MIAVTMGDPNGVGPEILLKAWAAGDIAEEFVAVGDAEVLEECARRVGIAAHLRQIASPSESIAGELNVLDLRSLAAAELTIGRISARAGRAAYGYVETATRLSLAGEVEAMVTLPLNKEAVRLAIPGFTGHTELIAELSSASAVAMMLASEKLIVTHVSTHVSLREAVARVTLARVAEVIGLTDQALRRLSSRRRIAVAGLNPHAGEHGSFGSEEESEIAPAIEQARSRGIDAVGPEPPDTVFFRAAGGEFDAVVCMYHDQGHIPMKLLSFETGVNVTLGLPFVRTSVDHGTAYDIAYRGTASTRSFLAAVRLARRLVR